MSNLNAIEEGKVNPKENRKSVDFLQNENPHTTAIEFQNSNPASGNQPNFANELLSDIKADGASFWDTNMQITLDA